MQTFPKDNPGVINCFMKTLRQDGIRRGLYAGATPSLVANIGENAVLFMAYGQCQKIIANLRGFESPEHMDPLGNAMSGSSAACFSSLILCPTEHIKCQLQVRREMAKRHPEIKMITALQLTKQLVRDHGVRELYKGLRATWSREIPGYFCFFGGYEGSKAILCRVNDCKKDELGFISQMFCGAMAGVTFWTGIFPLDVIKSRIQVDPEAGRPLEILRSVLKDRGIAGLYKGLAPCLIRAFPSTASLLATYEYVNYLLKNNLLKE